MRLNERWRSIMKDKIIIKGAKVHNLKNIRFRDTKR